jgi:transcriptional regulator with XRE-family HTH domain
MNAAAVGLLLARARRAAGLTQAGLAAAIGTTQSAISRAESGAANPTLDLIGRVAAATGRRIVIEFAPPRVQDRRARVRRVLGTYRFDPWDRDPSPAEARILEQTGMPRER